MARLGELTAAQDDELARLFDTRICLASDGGDLIVAPDQLEDQIEAGFVKQGGDGGQTLYLAPPGAPPQRP